MSKFIKYFILFSYVGTISGIPSSLFLYSLEMVTQIRIENPTLIFGLPFFGFFFGLILKRLPTNINQGVPYIVQEIDNEKHKVSVFTAPFIFIASITTHLFGGSAGREGVGVLMGASAAHVLPKTHKLFHDARIHLIYGGVAAGFASIFGTPIAGIIFAFELHRFKDTKKLDLLITTTLSAFIANFVTHALGPAHAQYPMNIQWSLSSWFSVILIGLLCSLGGLVFYYGMKFSHKLFKQVSRPEWKLFLGGAMVTAIVWLFHAHAYVGIGTEMIMQSFHEQMLLQDFWIKCLLTVLTLTVGFKGGEVTPLFFMGSTLSNAVLSKLSFTNFAFNSALGMVSIFAAVTKTPFASTFMACELFGYQIAPFALVCCFFSSALTGDRNIYKLS